MDNSSYSISDIVVSGLPGNYITDWSIEKYPRWNGWKSRVTSTLRFIKLNTTLTHWGRTTHICVGNLAIIGSDNGLSPGRHQAIIWTNNGILSIGHLRTNFSEIFIGIQTFSLEKMELKMSSAKWRLFCRGVNVLTTRPSPVSKPTVELGTAEAYMWTWDRCQWPLFTNMF